MCALRHPHSDSWAMPRGGRQRVLVRLRTAAMRDMHACDDDLRVHAITSGAQEVRWPQSAAQTCCGGDRGVCGGTGPCGA